MRNWQSELMKKCKNMQKDEKARKKKKDGKMKKNKKIDHRNRGKSASLRLRPSILGAKAEG